MKLLDDTKVKALEDRKKLGRNEELENKKEAEKQAYENGWREGHESGLEESKKEWNVKYEATYTEGKEHGQWEERNTWVLNHSEGLSVLYTPPPNPSGLRSDSLRHSDCPRTV